MKYKHFDFFQELPEESPAAERHQNPPEELRCLPQAEELAVVEALEKAGSLCWLNLSLALGFSFLMVALSLAVRAVSR
mgnify:CR=1 FL=1